MKHKPKLPIVIFSKIPNRALGLSYSQGIVILDEDEQGEDELLDSAIHEGLHQAWPNMTERRVKRAAPIIKSVVQQAGFRRNKKPRRSGA